MMGAGSIGWLPYAPIGAFLRPFRLPTVGKCGMNFNRSSAAILRGRVSGILKKIKAEKPVGLPRPFTVHGAFYSRRLRASRGVGVAVRP